MASAFALITLPASSDASTRSLKQILQSGNSKRSYYLFVPDALAGGDVAPLLVLLHGSGQNGLELLRPWTGLSIAEGFILAAPNAFTSTSWQIHRDGPRFVHDVIDSVALEHAVDRRRIYLFGFSAGAVHALTLAILESEYFAATAVFAGAWRDQKSYELVSHARRKIPIALFAGDRDEFFPLRSVRATVEALKEAGHPVMLTILKRSGHSYARVAARVNSDAWEFMHANRLDAEPKFQPYETV